MRSSLCTHAFHCTDSSKDPDIHILDRVNAGNESTPSTFHPPRQNVTTSIVGLKKWSHSQKTQQNKMMNPRDKAGNAEEEEKTFLQSTELVMVKLHTSLLSPVHA